MRRKKIKSKYVFRVKTGSVLWISMKLHELVCLVSKKSPVKFGECIRRFRSLIHTSSLRKKQFSWSSILECRPYCFENYRKEIRFSSDCSVRNIYRRKHYLLCLPMKSDPDCSLLSNRKWMMLRNSTRVMVYCFRWESRRCYSVSPQPKAEEFCERLFRIWNAGLHRKTSFLLRVWRGREHFLKYRNFDRFAVFRAHEQDRTIIFRQ